MYEYNKIENNDSDTLVELSKIDAINFLTLEKERYILELNTILSIEDNNDESKTKVHNLVEIIYDLITMIRVMIDLDNKPLDENGLNVFNKIKYIE